MSQEGQEVSIGCIGVLIMLAIIIGVGGFCVDYVVYTCWGKDLPTWADCCIGFLTSGIALTAAIICVIVKACDVPTPFFDQPVVASPVTPITQPAGI